ncbi:MAG: VWA domain-containing protein [Deltaproteobacteria bacterium]|nr:VWA domain-containing protein [Deltaproteobacteria bacterium]
MRSLFVRCSALALLVLAPAVVGCDCAGEDDRQRRRDAGPGEESDAPFAPPDAGDGDPCNDGFDGDGDGEVDEGCSCMPGTVQRCYRGEPALAGIGECSWGSQDCASTSGEFGVWDLCVGDGSPSPEVCDGVDNDCNGATDEGCECPVGATRDCYTGTRGEDVGLCHGGTETCVIEGGLSTWSGCEGEVLPAATEECDGSEDEDCDGLVDEGCTCTSGDTRSCYGGPPGTLGVGACRGGTQSCTAGGWGSCVGAVLPGSERCTGGVDEDCDGLADCDDPLCTDDTSCCTPFDDAVPVVPSSVELLFIVDRSGSMDYPATGTTRTRWEELRTAMDSVLPLLGDLPLGLLTFPEMDGTSESLSCRVASTPDIGIMLGATGAISARLVLVDPRAGDTPTPDAIATADAYIRSHPTTVPRFIVLATDGLPEPNCGATVSATVSAISTIRTSLGVDTFVLGFVGPDRSGDTSGIPALQAGLNEMAVAGGRPRAGALRYYEAVDGPAFERALRAILAAATDCAFELTSAPPRPDRVTVRQNGVVVPASRYTITGTHLEFSGVACDAIRSGSVMTISVSDGC